MSGHAPVRLLVNPAAGRGRALRRLDAARHALARVGPFDMVTTEASGDEERLATAAAQDGVQTLAVLGGDGTISRVAAALVRAGSPTALAIFGAGTGNDLAKSLGAPVFDFRTMADRILAHSTRVIDVGAINDHVFVNAVGVGFDVAVLERTARARWLRGDALYAVTALGQLFRYDGFSAQLLAADHATSDRAATPSPQGDPGASTRAFPSASRWLTIVVANGRWFGGAFCIAPDAQLDDGTLDLVAIGDASPLRRARLFGGAPWGHHVREAEVHYDQRARLTLQFAQPPMYQADGELHRATTRELHIHVLPRALTVTV